MTQHKATITRLDIAGFKSFADDIHLDILPGLTGIVGPNGCGKSNIVEALRWAMGESSARALRGGESDDLIFAGTGARSSRNLAKVTLSLENAQGLAPAPFTDSDELNISRQAERGRANTYRINGQTMRARDVQTMFADLSSGARSSSIISQNRVSQLIAAKPEERRSLLDEAAGITGLHARRHDAELKLRHSENNLERAEDRRHQLEALLVTLKEQSTHARHYRHLSEKIRDTECQLLALQHARAQKNIHSHQRTLTQTQEALRATEEKVRTVEQQHTEQQKRETAHQERLDELRPTIDELRIHIKIAQQTLEHSHDAQKKATERLQQINSDLERQAKTRAQLSERKEALHQEITQLEQRKARFPEERRTLQEKLEQLLKAKHEQHQHLTQLNDRYHAESLHQETLKSRLQDRQQHVEKQQNLIAELEAELETLRHEHATLPSHDQALKDAEHARSHEKTTHQDYQTKQRAYQDHSVSTQLAVQSLEQAKDTATRLEKRLNAYMSHLEGLKKRLKTTKNDSENLQHALLSSDKKRALEEAVSKAQQAARVAHTHEQNTLSQKEQADHHWLEKRAEYDERQQQHRALTEEQARLNEAVAQHEKRYHAAEQAVQNVHASAPLSHDGDHARELCTALETQLTQQTNALSASQKELENAQHREEDARRSVMKNETALSQCHGECEGLRQSLGTSETQTPDPIIDHIRVPKELTRALACALTDGLEASLSAPSESPADNQFALRHWTMLPPFPRDDKNAPPSPQLTSLLTHVEAPESLTRALSAIFLIDDSQQGSNLQKHLSPGQSLVSREGHVWRWDGFVRSDKAPSAEAIRLEQQQRLQTRSQEEKTLSAALKNAQKILTEQQKHLAACRDAVAHLSKEEQALKERYNQQRFHVQEHERRLSFHHEKLTLAQAHLEEQHHALHALKARLKETHEALASLPEEHHETVLLAQQDAQTAQEKARQAREASQECQKNLSQAERAYEQALLHHQATKERLTELQDAYERLTQEISRQENDIHQIHQEQKHLDIQTQEKKVRKKEALLKQLTTQLEHAHHTHDKAHHNAEGLNTRYAQLERALTALNTRLDTLQKRLTEQKEALTLLHTESAQLEKERAALPDVTETQRSLEKAQTTFNALQEEINTLENQHARLQQEEHNHHAHIEALKAQYVTLKETWTHLCTEEQSLTQRRAELMNVPDNNKNTHEELQHTITHNTEKLRILEKEMQNTHDTLRHLQQEKEKIAAQHLRENEVKAHYREEVVRIKERLQQAQQSHDTLCQDHPLPEHVPALTDVTAQAEQRLRRHIKRHTQEREALGPVNLCAEDEFQKAHDESQHLLQEHTDLTSAIARLRGGIGAINRQGRVKLTEVFTEINAHFQTLFVRMFGGGNAHLALVGSDDPLEAGLEIFAQPPGKKLSTLSLLSGGEQALTALSLIFAAFHCTPAPLCVLDEVDAPLDDANTERFCHLLTDMVQQTRTRFLIITHHQLTMAHMDRLFGVTMQERGVSRLLSVNLDESIKMANG